MIKQPSLFIHTTNTESEIVSGFTVSSGVDLSLYKANIAIYMFVTAQILFVAYFTRTLIVKSKKRKLQAI